MTRSAARRLGSASVALLVGGLMWTASAPASEFGGFEIDGNTVDAPAISGVDWDTPGLDVTTVGDASGAGDDVFGAKSPQLKPANWTCVTGAAAADSDILQAQWHPSTDYLHLGVTRVAAKTELHVDFEFNQSQAAACPQRTPGDLLIALDTRNGGATAIVRAFRWNANGTFTALALGGAQSDAAASAPVKGKFDFAELGLNLSSSPVGAIPCDRFASVYVKTRAAEAIDSNLRDRTAAKPLCAPAGHLVKEVRKGPDSAWAADVAPVVPGAGLEYRLTYSNDSAIDQTGVVLSDPLAAHQTFVSCSDACTADGTVRWDVGTVAAGQRVVRTFIVRLDSAFPAAGTFIIPNIGYADADGRSRQASNETHAAGTASPSPNIGKQVRNVTTNSPFSMTASASPGDTIEYVLSVSNNGTAPETNVSVNDTLAAGQTFASCTGGCAGTGALTWNVGTIAPGASAQVTVRVVLDATFPSGSTTITNVGDTRSTEVPRPVPSNQTTVTVTAP